MGAFPSKIAPSDGTLQLGYVKKRVVLVFAGGGGKTSDVAMLIASELQASEEVEVQTEINLRRFERRDTRLTAGKANPYLKQLLEARGVTDVVYAPDYEAGDGADGWLDVATRSTYNLLLACAHAKTVEKVHVLTSMGSFLSYPENAAIGVGWRPRPTAAPDVLAPHMVEYVAREFARAGIIHVCIARLGEVTADVVPQVAVGQPVNGAEPAPAPPHFRTTAKDAAVVVANEILRVPSFDTNQEASAFFRPNRSYWQVLHVHVPITSTNKTVPAVPPAAPTTASPHASPPEDDAATDAGTAEAESAEGAGMKEVDVMLNKMLDDENSAAHARPIGNIVMWTGGSKMGASATGAQAATQPKTRVLLLGAGGFLGPHLLDALHQEPDLYTVTATDVREQDRGHEPDSTAVWRDAVLKAYHQDGRLDSIVPLDISDGDAVAEAAGKVDVIVNCAVTRYDPVLTWRVNCLGTLNAVRAAVASGTYHVAPARCTVHDWTFTRDMYSRLVLVVSILNSLEKRGVVHVWLVVCLLGAIAIAWG